MYLVGIALISFLFGIFMGTRQNSNSFRRRKIRLEIAKREGYSAKILQGTPDPLPEIIETKKRVRKLKNAEENAIRADEERAKNGS